MNKNNLPSYLGIAIAIGILIGAFFSSNKGLNIGSSANELKIKKLLNYIESDYVDTVNTDSLLDNAIRNMLIKLDPHSVYIEKEQLQEITENMQGNFVGIGIAFEVKNDSIVVINPTEDGPSIEAGIKSGDRILKADTISLHRKKLTSKEIMKLLKGKPDTKINLEIYRKTNDSLFTVTVTRRKINIKSIDISYMINDSIGYIKLNRFARNSYHEFKSSLTNLLSKGMTDLVLDLRDNSGGFIDIAQKITDEFLEEDKLIVFTKNNKGKIEKLFATSEGSFEQGGLYVLINQHSASASEIVAGALQDNDKGIIIGRRSFGKGLVQQEMDLGDGSAVRLTTARYYTPTGRSIQKPYTHDGKELAYKNDLNNRFLTGELVSKDSIKIIDSLQYKTPKGKIVYGGGGIVPDVFVPVDTTFYLPLGYNKRLNDFTFEYVDENREKLNTISMNDFIKDFTITPSIIKSFSKKNKDLKTIRLYEKSIKRYLKIKISQELFSDDGFYRLKHKDDKMIKKVFELEAKNNIKK